MEGTVVDEEGKELENSSSVSLHCRKGTRFGYEMSVLTSISRSIETYLGARAHIRLHLQTLTKIHQALIDLASLS